MAVLLVLLLAVPVFAVVSASAVEPAAERAVVVNDTAAVITSSATTMSIETSIVLGAVAVMLVVMYTFAIWMTNNDVRSERGWFRHAALGVLTAALLITFVTYAPLISLMAAVVMFALARSLWLTVQSGRVAMTPMFAVTDTFDLRRMAENDTNEGEPHRRLFSPMGPLPVAVG